jgi:RNA polymerase-binding transcription factor DksA
MNRAKELIYFKRKLNSTLKKLNELDKQTEADKNSRENNKKYFVDIRDYSTGELLMYLSSQKKLEAKRFASYYRSKNKGKNIKYIVKEY